MEPTDRTVEILKEIRDEGRKTNERLERLERRQAESEIRIATEIVGVAGAVREVRELLREDLSLRSRVEDHERRLAAIEARSG